MRVRVRVRVRLSTLVVGGLGLLWLLIASESDAVAFAYRAHDLRVTLEAAAAVIGGLTALLVFGRFRTSSSVTDLLIVYAFVVLAFANLAFTALPAVLAASRVEEISAQLRLASGLLGGAALALAATVRSTDPRARTPVVLSLLVMPVVAVAVALGIGQPDAPSAPPVDPAGGARPIGPGAVQAVQGLTALFFAVASARFARISERERDRFLGWIAAACAVAAVARVGYLLFPAFPREWVHIGDLLRLVSYVLLMAGAAGEIRRYWESQASAAVVDERRRIARELHDGMAQELAFIATQSKRAASAAAARGQNRAEPDVSLLRQLSSAAERALDESRRALAALVQPVETLDAAIAQTVEAVAGRRGAAVELDLARGVRLAPAAREDLLRIIREAVSNATRHGEAQRVSVSLASSDGHTRVVISDDGAGFDPSSTGPGGFGLTSMRERAEAHGGTVVVSSTPGAGTEVEVTLPSLPSR